MFIWPQPRTHEDRINHIKKKATNELLSKGFEASDENLYWFYKGLLEAWTEDPEKTIEKTYWVFSLRDEIDRIGSTLTEDQKDPDK